MNTTQRVPRAASISATVPAGGLYAEVRQTRADLAGIKADLALTAFLDAADAAGGRISLPVRIRMESVQQGIPEPLAMRKGSFHVG